jgi:hypothetical protein
MGVCSACNPNTPDQQVNLSNENTNQPQQVGNEESHVEAAKAGSNIIVVNLN